MFDQWFVICVFDNPIDTMEEGDLNPRLLRWKVQEGPVELQDS